METERDGGASLAKEDATASGQESAPQVVQREVQRVEQFQGPLPPPDALAQYEEAVPGAGDRMLQVYERQVEHRHRMESALVSDGSAQARRGIVAGTIVALAVLCLAGYALYLGEPAAAGVLGAVDIIGIVWAYIYGTRRR